MILFWISIILALTETKNRIKKYGYVHYKKSKKSSVEIFVSILEMFILSIIPFINIVIAVFVIFNFDEYVEKIIKGLTEKGEIIKKGE